MNTTHMAKTKKQMTIEEHIEIGKRLKAIDVEYLDIYNQICRTYGKSCRSAKLARTQAQTMSSSCKIRCELDDTVAQETSLHDWHKYQYGNIYMGGDYHGKE